MRYYHVDVVFQEVPDEISLLFAIAGCSIACQGCHSFEYWNEKNYPLLDDATYEQYLEKYKNQITCVCFFGGEWEPKRLVELLKIARKTQLKTCLYTGLYHVNPRILSQLDFIKTGPWQMRKGGLDQPSTNQKFMRVLDRKVLNDKFQSP